MRLLYKKGENIIFDFKWEELTAAYVTLYGFLHSGCLNEQGKLIVSAQIAKMKFHMDEIEQSKRLLLEDKRFKSHMCKVCYRMFKEGEQYETGSEEGYPIYWHATCPPLKDKIQ